MRSFAITLVAVSWLTFWLYWVLSAAQTGRANRTAHYGKSWPRLVIVFVIVLAIYVPFSRHAGAGYQIAQHRSWLRATGVILFYAGLSLAVWARRYLGHNWGMPMSLIKDAQLVTTGPYAYIRHPIYSGLILAALGTFLVTTFTWLLVLSFASVYFSYASIQEDKQMARQFPKTYPAYKRRTKMLIPYIF